MVKFVNSGPRKRTCDLLFAFLCYGVKSKSIHIYIRVEFDNSLCKRVQPSRTDRSKTTRKLTDPHKQGRRRSKDNKSRMININMCKWYSQVIYKKPQGYKKWKGSDSLQVRYDQRHLLVSSDRQVALQYVSRNNH